MKEALIVLKNYHLLAIRYQLDPELMEIFQETSNVVQNNE